MQKRVKNRLIIIIISLTCIAIGIYIILYNLEKNIVFFLPPSKISQIDENKEVRIGGLVKENSIVKISPDEISFVITDDIKNLEILYKGILPALFRDKQGIIAVGKMTHGKFEAYQLLIKHDENYYPPKQK